jgi:hypothetical protein
MVVVFIGAVASFIIYNWSLFMCYYIYKLTKMYIPCAEQFDLDISVQIKFISERQGI